MDPDKIEQSRDEWRSLCLRLARHLLNPNEMDVFAWGAKSVDLLAEVQKMDPIVYRDLVSVKD